MGPSTWWWRPAICQSISRSAVRLQLADHHRDLLLGIIHQRDAASPPVTAAAVAGGELADVGLAGPPEDAVAEEQHREAAVRAPVDAGRDVDLREEGVNHETVADRRVVEAAEVGHDHIAVHPALAAQLLAEVLVLALQHVATLLDGGIVEDRRDRRLPPQQLDQVQEVALEGAEAAPAVDGEAELDVGL